MGERKRYGSFTEFWPFYVAEHSRPSTRRLHFCGTALALVCFLLLAATRRWMFLGIGVMAGYACAWVGHFFFEKNRPATFGAPLYSLAADWKMFFLMLSGHMDAEIRKLAERPANKEQLSPAPPPR